MAEFHVRRAAPFDLGTMAGLLNAIIARGGTTAMVNPVTPDDIASWIAAPAAVFHVAEAAGRIAGFQWIEPHDDLPPEACDIATFVQPERSGMGIGSALFAATEPAARRLGYRWINATIRADNDGGLAYYQSRGFRDWQVIRGVALRNGLVVDKVCKRYDLD
jgi:L-amino acid N-acyltransferase YncA